MKIFGILILGMLFIAGPALAQTSARGAPAPVDNAHYGWADVLRVDPVYDDAGTGGTSAPCYQEQVPVQETPVAENDAGSRTVGGVLGAIVGGILGHQLGKGEGRKATTAVGSVTGAWVGSNMAAAETRAAARRRYTVERHCPGETQESTSRHVNAYDVEYRYRGEIYTARLGYDPGDRIRVRVTVTPAE
jgi:uncharacterized protein YcfJ